MECTVLLGVRFSLCGVLCYFHIWIRIRRICVKSNTSCTKVNIFMPPPLDSAAFILDIIKCKSSQPFFLPLSSMLCFGLFDDVCSMFTAHNGARNLKFSFFVPQKDNYWEKIQLLKSQWFKTSNMCFPFGSVDSATVLCFIGSVFDSLIIASSFHG